MMDKWNSARDHWTDLPLHTVLYEWTSKNVRIPVELYAIIVNVALFLIAWYIIVWLKRIVMSIIGPLLVLAGVIVVCHIIQVYEPEELLNLVAHIFNAVVQTMVTIFNKIIEIVLRQFD